MQFSIKRHGLMLLALMVVFTAEAQRQGYMFVGAYGGWNRTKPIYTSSGEAGDQVKSIIANDLRQVQGHLFGAQMQYFATKTIALTAGVGYVGRNYGNTELYEGIDLDDPDLPDQLQSVKYTNYTNFVEIPVGARWSFVDGGVDFVLLGGLAYNIWTKHKVDRRQEYYSGTVEEETYTVEIDQRFKNKLAFYLGVGMETMIGDRLLFSIEYVYDRLITQQYRKDPTQYPTLNLLDHRVGIRLGYLLN